MSRREQQLVNAQVEVNRAVHLMNRQMQSQTERDGRVVSNADIVGHIDGAIKELQAARAGYVDAGRLRRHG